MISTVVLLALSLGALWLSVGEWRTERPTEAGVGCSPTSVLPGEAHARERAVIPTISVTMSALAISVIANIAAEGDRDSAAEVLRWIGDASAIICVVGMCVSLSVFLFMRPRFVVPPYLRDTPGYVKGLWQQWRRRG